MVLSEYFNQQVRRLVDHGESGYAVDIAYQSYDLVEAAELGACRREQVHRHEPSRLIAVDDAEPTSTQE